MNAILKQDFDSSIFDIPYFRIINYDDIDQVNKELKELQNDEPVIIDAKREASDKEWGLFLQKKGFRKVCVQVELEKEPKTTDEVEVDIDDNIEIPDSMIKKHAKNFSYDRFSLDPLISIEKRDLLYYTWIKNSFLNPDIKIAHKGNGFCSFKIKKQTASIDLISVLEKGQNIGAELLIAVNNYAANLGLTNIKVITETENWNAVRFYINNGYHVSQYVSCFHYVVNN